MTRVTSYSLCHNTIPGVVLMGLSFPSPYHPNLAPSEWLSPLWTTEEALWRKILLSRWQGESWDALVGVNMEPWFHLHRNQTAGLLLPQMSHLLWRLHGEIEGLLIIPCSCDKNMSVMHPWMLFIEYSTKYFEFPSFNVSIIVRFDIWFVHFKWINTILSLQTLFLICISETSAWVRILLYFVLLEWNIIVRSRHICWLMANYSQSVIMDYINNTTGATYHVSLLWMWHLPSPTTVWSPCQALTPLGNHHLYHNLASGINKILYYGHSPLRTGFLQPYHRGRGHAVRGP